MAQDYNNTINLPKTEFAMRAALPQREPGFLKDWEEKEVYKLMLEKNAGKPKFILHDGPPFSNGNIHMGHALNKSLKDFMNRHKAMDGYLTPYVPGWDNHGMPIESAIIKKNKLNQKNMSVAEFRSACQEFAQNYVNIQMDQFKRLGVLADWEHPYLTMDPGFEAEEVKVFGAMYKKGYIYKGLKPVYWCTHDETALAEAEIEYKDEPCASIFVKFALKDDQGKMAKYGDTSKMFFIIWTTTTWTLPGNLAIALNPVESYVLLKADNGEMYIVAEALADTTMKNGGIDSYEIVDRFDGSFFEYMTAQHPFLDRDSLLVLADYVTMEDGTGCVHTAPGFGAEDNITGRKYNLPLLVPVDDKGYQTEDAGMFAGMKFDESNDAILKHLKETGALFASKEIVHSYPHCWRCKNPIIFRATPQWFCSVEAFKEDAVEACRTVRWLPAWGEDRITSMIRERADWCISRQRRWGLPIPVIYCKECGKPICNDETIEHIAGLFAKEGSNAWYLYDEDQLVPEGFVCPHCGGKHFEKETDTLDCWFDSGSTNIASLLRDNADEWPADVYIEGADQYRGWFQSSLLAAVGALGGGAPYKNVLTHGWVVDGEGKAMHKSLGNSIAPEEIINKYGADLLRLWVACSDYHVDVRVSDVIFKQLTQVYLKIRNTCRYILGNLDGFDPNNLVSGEDMEEIDRWAITKLDDLTKRVLAAYDEFEYHPAIHAINNFCVVEMSNFYLDVIKDRLYCDERNGNSRRSAQTAIFVILDSMTKLFAPILAFTSDEIWQVMPHRDGDDKRHIILNTFNKDFGEYVLSEEKMAKWDKLIALRDDINSVLEAARAEKKIGKPLEAKVVLECRDAVIDEIKADADTLKTMLIVSQVEVKAGSNGKQCASNTDVYASVQTADGGKCERCWCYSETVGQNSEHPTLCARCAAVVSKL
ncbi:MAG: isoleucine--tRNA ligase [Clostridia bacterium]|nr:isoleucine--tRNA ligase [Clostridia bacterium]